MAVRIVTLVSLLLLAPAVVLPGAQAASPSFGWGSDLSQWWSYMDAERTAAINAAKASGMTHMATDASDAGLIGWATPNYPGFTAMRAGDGAVERVVRDAGAAGIKVIARFDVFQDINAAKVYPSTVIGGNPVWVDPACPEIRAYELAKLKDFLTRVNVHEINLDHVRYPGTDEVASGTRLPCTGSTLGDVAHKDRNQIIASWVQEASAAARAIRPGILVSASTFGYTMHGPMPNIGQDASKLAPHLDILRPMIYPSYYSAKAESQPYATVKDSTARGVATFGAAKVQPWIQGFDAYAGSTWALCEQYRALRDAGASGGLVWWFPSTGMSTTFWQTVASCVPATAPAAVPAPAPAPAPAPEPAPEPAPGETSYATGFAPKAGNNWWVETNVVSERPLAGVAASVDGGAPVALALTKWGSWAKSFYVAPGSHVRFVATATDGATASSGLYEWPTATPLAEPAPGPAPEPEPAPEPAPGPVEGAFTATFEKGSGGKRWVEVFVHANAPVAGVTASVNGGTPVALEKTSSESWAKSLRLAKGSTIVFAATSADGQTATSEPFRWT